MKKLSLYLLLGLVVFSITSCTEESLCSFPNCLPIDVPDVITNNSDAVALEPEEAYEVNRIVNDWLECEECSDSTRTAVVDLKDKAVLCLAYTLFQGPSPAKLEAKRIHLNTTYQDLVEEEGPNQDLPLSEEEFRNLYMTNYINLYQRRSIEALRAIDTDFSRTVLDIASNTGDFDLRVKNNL